MRPVIENSKIDTLLIAACLVPSLLGFVWGGEADALWLFRISFLALIILGGYYFFLHRKNTLAITFVLFLVGVALDVYFGHQKSYMAYRAGVRSLFGIWMLVSTVRYIHWSKNFELITFLASMALMMNALFFTFVGLDRTLTMFLLFGSTFTVATVVYYENLWDRYHAIEKKWMILCLLSLVLDVLYFSKGIF